MIRAVLRAFGALVLLAAGAFGVCSLDLRPARTAGVEEVREAVLTVAADTAGAGIAGAREVAAGHFAGAAEVDVTPARPMPLGGYSARRGRPFEGIRDPVMARAVALSGSADGSPMVLVGLDVALVPSALAGAIRAAVRERVGDAAEVVVTATHTHAGPGGLWEGWVAAAAGMGRHDPAYTASLVAASADAAERAAGARVPVTVARAEGEGPPICSGRRAGRPDDRRLSVVRFVEVEGPSDEGFEREREGEGEGEGERVPVREGVSGGRTVARVVVFACHPTFLGHRDLRVSGGWPGETAKNLDGVTLVLQGAVGDQRTTAFDLDALGLDGGETFGRGDSALSPAALDVLAPEGRMTAAGWAVAAAVRRLEAEAGDGEAVLAAATENGPAVPPAPAIAFRSVEVHLPQATGATVAPAGLRGIAGNVLARAAPETVRVSALRIGDRRLVFVPGEVVSVLAEAWETGPDVRVVSLADGYVGYLETSDALAERAGESGQAYFGADAVALFGEAVAALLADAAD